MSNLDIQEYFVEAVSNVSHANGVFRITFAQNEDETTVRPITRLLIPANQLARILQGLNNAAKTIGEKVKEKKEDQQADATEPSDDKDKPAQKVKAEPRKKLDS